MTEPDMAKNVAAFYEAYAIPADSFARMSAFAISQPADVDINAILVSADGPGVVRTAP